MQPGPRAVVVDTNFVKRGVFDESALRRLAERLGQRGHELIVPEVVAWEWAEHAHAAATSLERAIVDGNRLLDPAFGLSMPAVVIPPVEEFVAVVVAALAKIPYVELGTAPSEAARVAIASQVLQTGVASRTRDGTKTGAADGLVLSVVSGLLREFDEVVLATADKRLAGEARSIDARLTVVANQRELWEWHGVAPPTDERMKESLWLFLCDEAYGGVGPGKVFPLFQSGWFIDDESYTADHVVGPRRRFTNVFVTDVDYPDMSDVEVVEAATPPYLVIADFSVHCTVAITESVDTGDGATAVERSFSSNAIVYADVSVEFGDDWSPRSLHVEEPAQISLTPPA